LFFAPALLAPAMLILALSLASPAPAGASLPPAPRVDARAYLVMNATSGDVLVSKNVDERLPIASLTKLMTVGVALEHLSLDRYVTVSARAAGVGEESAGLIAGERITVADLVRAALIQSANDAADALADAASGGDRALFVSWMNQEARKIGLTRTHFERPDGLDAPGHYSTARDITHLAQWAMRLAVVRQDVRMRTSTISGGRRLTTWNDLLGVFPGVVGVKTGHTDNAGWCQVTLLEREGLEIYVTILGSPTRAQRDHDLEALLRFALSRYEVVNVVSAGDPLMKVATEYGRGTVPVAVARSLDLPIRVDRPLVEKLVLPRTLSLPVRRGQGVGEVRISSNGRLLAKRELFALRFVGKPGLLGRAGWYGSRTVHELLGWL
jgi:D-alanyl-D-alanine carboxypeptidase (penicillin-binding protein 5/6)